MNAIDDLFRRLRNAKQKAFLPFVPAGDPDIATTANLIRELDSAGAHAMEIGFPFSDPIADGPVIQAAYTRALHRGLKTDDVFGSIQRAGRVNAPVLGMVSYSLVHRRGVDAFLKQAKASGISGLIVPDLPVEEANELAGKTSDSDLRLVLLVTPTTPPARAEKIVKLSNGFVYCVSVAGITGERDRLPDELLVQLRRLRGMTALPLCVGFGVSKPEHVRMLREDADGVIIGSAIVRRIEQIPARGWEPVAAELRNLVGSLLAALNP